MSSCAVVVLLFAALLMVGQQQVDGPRPLTQPGMNHGREENGMDWPREKVEGKKRWRRDGVSDGSRHWLLPWLVQDQGGGGRRQETGPHLLALGGRDGFSELGRPAIPSLPSEF
ncbi:hypothetical protein LZ30DRAFT_733653, partial [Colletotrichum cereale]